MLHVSPDDTWQCRSEVVMGFRNLFSARLIVVFNYRLIDAMHGCLIVDMMLAMSWMVIAIT